MNETIRLKITFDFNYLDNIDQLLSNIKIIHKSFNTSVSYVFEINEIDAD